METHRPEGYEIEIRLLGRFEILLEGVPLYSHKGRGSQMPWMLLQYLLLNRHENLSKQQLVTALWPNGEATHPDRALNNLAWRLRGILAGLGLPFAGQVLVFEKGCYRINNSLGWNLDTERMEALFHAGRKSEDEQARARSLEQALGLYQGDLLVGIQEREWATAARVFYQSIYLMCAKKLLPLLQTEGRHTQALAICQRALAISPFDEGLHAACISSLMAQSHTGQALEHYSHYAARLQARYNRAPGPELEGLYNRLQCGSAPAESLALIRKALGDGKAPTGGLYCSADQFKALYRLAMRRGANASFLVVNLCCQPPSGAPKAESPLGLLHQVIYASLHNWDAFTSYGGQFLLLLDPALTDPLATIERIETGFNSFFPGRPPYSLEIIRTTLAEAG